jgi:O-antigen/teichoic acid export membrane protein
MKATPDRAELSDVAALVAGRGIAAAFGLATTLIVAAAIDDKATYGSYALALSLAGMVVVVADLGLTSALARYAADQQADRALLLRVILVRAGLAAAAGVAMVLFGAVVDRGWAGRSTDEELLPPFLYLGGALILAQSFSAFLGGLLPTLRRVRALATLNVVQTFSELVGVLVVVALAIRPEWFLLVAALAAALASAAGFVILLKHPPRGGSPVSLGTLARYGRSLFVVGVLFAVFGAIDQAVLWLFKGPAEVAPYALSWRLIAMLSLPAIAAAVVIAPRIAPGGQAERRTFRLWVSRLGHLYLAGGVISAVLAPQIFDTVASQYRPDASVLAALTLYTVLMGVAPLITTAANFLGGARDRIRLAGIAVGLNVVLDLLLIPPLGAYGAALATSVAFALYVGTHMQLTYRLLGGTDWFYPTLRRIPQPLVHTAAAAGLAWALAELLESGPALIALLVPAAAALGLYALLLSGPERVWQGSRALP